jgi:predicted MarR family transcription regulator
MIQRHGVTYKALQFAKFMNRPFAADELAIFNPAFNNRKNRAHALLQLERFGLVTKTQTDDGSRYQVTADGVEYLNRLAVYYRQMDIDHSRFGSLAKR